MISDTVHIFQNLNNYYPLSGALVQHLKHVLTQKHYPKGHLLLRPGQVPRYTWFIQKGSERSYVFDDLRGEQVTAWFWHAGDVVVAHDSFCSQVPTVFYMELLENSVLQRISYEVLEQTAVLYPAIRHLELAIMEEFPLRIYRHYQERSCLNARERFEKLMLEQPQLFNIAAVKDIASFLGLTPNTLSRLRSGKQRDSYGK